jgi:hypothetical protein
MATMVTVATLAAVATSMAATAVAAAAIAAAAARAAVAAMVTETSVRLLLAAQQGDSDNRDKNRDAQNQRAIHLRILLQGTGTYGSLNNNCRPTFSSSNRDGTRKEETLFQARPGFRMLSLQARKSRMGGFADCKSYSGCTV